MMWTRVDLKTRAKSVLRKNYWRAFLVSLVLLIAGVSYGSSMDFSWKNNSGSNVHYTMSQLSRDLENVVNNDIRRINPRISTYINETGDVISTYVYRIESNTGGFFPNLSSYSGVANLFLLVLGFGLLIFGVVAMFFRVLVGYGLEVGGRRYFINAADNPKTDFKTLGLVFRSGHYINVVITMFLRSLFTFLWSLLFIIPGIVKKYAYSMVPYILADNPGITSRRALELSNKFTYGHKWEMFVLDLSFIGWYILGGICFGIGVVFVYPYENSTKAELYLTLRNNAIDSGAVSCEELGLTPVYDYADAIIAPPAKPEGFN